MLAGSVALLELIPFFHPGTSRQGRPQGHLRVLAVVLPPVASHSQQIERKSLDENGS